MKKEEKGKEKGRGRRKKKGEKPSQSIQAPQRVDTGFFFFLNKYQVDPFRGNPLSGQRNPFKGGGVIRHPFGGLGLLVRKGVTLF